MAERRLKGVGELLDRTWRAFSGDWWKLMVVAAVPGGVVMGTAAVAAVMIGVVVYTSPGTAAGVLLAMAVVLVPVALWFFGWTQAAMIMAAKMAMAGEKVGVRAVYGRARSLAWKMIGVSALSGLVAMGGTMLLVIPGIVVAVWMVTAMYIVVDEGVGGMTALLKSKYYVRGRWWAVAGRVLLMGVLAVGVGLISQALLVIPVLGWVVAMGVQLAISIGQIIFVYALYSDLKETVQGEFVVGAGKGSFMALAGLGLLLPIMLVGAALVLAAINPAQKLEKAKEMEREMRELKEGAQSLQRELEMGGEGGLQTN